MDLSRKEMNRPILNSRMKKIFGMAFLFIICAPHIFGQQLVVHINDKPIKNNSIVSTIPNYIDTKILPESSGYVIADGKFSIRDRTGKKVLFTSRIDSSYIKSLPLEYSPGSKVLIEVRSIRNVQTGAITAWDKFVVFHLAEELFPEENPYHDLLINNSAAYKKEGIIIDSIKSVKIKSKSDNLMDSLMVLQARGNRAVHTKMYLSKKFTELEESKYVFKNGVTGDRFIIYIWDKDRRKQWVWVVPIKKGCEER